MTANKASPNRAKPSEPYRRDTKRRLQRNHYLNSSPGIMKRVSDMMNPVELNVLSDTFCQVTLNTAVQKSCAFLSNALEGKAGKEPAIWLRRASLMQLDSTQSDFVKLHATERAVRMMESSLASSKAPDLDFHEPMHIDAMIGLAFRCEQMDRPDLTLRLLDIADTLDPDNEQYMDSREKLRDLCQPITIRPYIPPSRPDAISPSAVPPAIGQLKAK